VSIRSKALLLRSHPSSGSSRPIGWTAEGDGTYGFVFMERCRVRILLEVTPRDPRDPDDAAPPRSSCIVKRSRDLGSATPTNVRIA
jgi:hypothetical protein